MGQRNSRPLLVHKPTAKPDSKHSMSVSAVAPRPGPEIMYPDDPPPAYTVNDDADDNPFYYHSPRYTPDLLRDVDPSTVVGYRHTSASKTAQLFDSSLRLRFPDIQAMMKTHREAAAAQPHSKLPHLAKLILNRPFFSPFSPCSPGQQGAGFFATAPRVRNSKLYIHTLCRIHAPDPLSLHTLLTASNPETWLRPCRHLGLDTYHRLPLRNHDLSRGEFLAYARAHGNWRPFEFVVHDRAPFFEVFSCGYCCTDYCVRFWTRSVEGGDGVLRAKAGGGGDGEGERGDEGRDEIEDVEVGVDIDVWHCLGAGRDPMERAWLRIAAAAPFTTLTAPRPGFVRGGVVAGYEARE